MNDAQDANVLVYIITTALGIVYYKCAILFFISVKILVSSYFFFFLDYKLCKNVVSKREKIPSTVVVINFHTR